MKNILGIVGVILLIQLIQSCKKGERPTIATVTVTNITGTSATGGGTITDEGSSTVISRGVCWSTRITPTLYDSKTIDGAGTGSFTSNITGLGGATVYYVRAYATNDVGIGYGMTMSFTTLGQTPYTETYPATNITKTSATINGSVNANYLSTVVTFEYGSTTSYGSTAIAAQSPATGNSITDVSADITGLAADTIYHFRVKAVNSLGTNYGYDMTINTTSSSITITDVDGNVYTSVNIGTQVWMAENLKTTKYNDGTPIPNITDNTAWTASTTGMYSDYSNTPSNSTTYGRLYNWYIVDNNAATKMASNSGKNVCPTDWHVPSDDEWTTLTTSLGGWMFAGGSLKETGTTHWWAPNEGATNSSGFTALPSGYRSLSGSYYFVGNYGYWWSSSEYSSANAYHRSMDYRHTSVASSDSYSKQNGFSVRCLKD